jgi:hypothetical protein
MTAEPNPTIARLDRTALKLGLKLNVTGTNSRTIDLGTRLISYKPGGKGVIRVQSSILSESGATLDAESVVSIERMERIMKFASTASNQ